MEANHFAAALLVGTEDIAAALRQAAIIIAYMQARLPARRAMPVLRREEARLRDFALHMGIPVDEWYRRAKGLSPLPTVEERIAAGLIYCLLVDRWDRLRRCQGHWDDLWPLCEQHRVRRIAIAERCDISYRREPQLFLDGYWSSEPKPPRYLCAWYPRVVAPDGSSKVPRRFRPRQQWRWR